MDDTNESTNESRGSNNKVGWIITIILLVGIFAGFFLFKGTPNMIDQQTKRTVQQNVRSGTKSYDKHLVNKVLQYNVNQIPTQLRNDPKYEPIINVYEKQTQNARKQSQLIKRQYVF